MNDKKAMTLDTLEKDINEVIPTLFEMARSLTWNNISENHKFILTEIKDNSENFHERRKKNKQENDKKNPISLTELMPTLRALYDNFYDINLHIYKSTKSLTIIDFRYYPKTSLDKDYRLKVLNNSPMLHCKVSMPTFLSYKKEKFDINWEHKSWLIKLKVLWQKKKLRP